MITKIEMQYMEAVKRIASEMAKPNEIDWEARRYEIAKAHIAGATCLTKGQARQAAEAAVMVADALIAQLGGPTDNKR